MMDAFKLRFGDSFTPPKSVSHMFLGMWRAIFDNAEPSPTDWNVVIKVRDDAAVSALVDQVIADCSGDFAWVTDNIIEGAIHPIKLALCLGGIHLMSSEPLPVEVDWDCTEDDVVYRATYDLVLQLLTNELCG